MDHIEKCPICDQPLSHGDLCASDIELGTCHAACLEGSPVVDLDTGEELPDGKINTFPYEQDQLAAPALQLHVSDDDLPTLHSETTLEGGVIRLSKWPEGYVLWYHGKIVFRSWTDTAEYAAQNPAHFDNRAVSNFAYAMRIKLAAKRLEGRGGWQDKEQCSNEYLSRLLREHVEKGDPVDVANFCMMLDQRHESIAPASETDVPVEDEISRVLQSVNEWDDRTSPDDYPDHLLITSEELADILRNFARAIAVTDEVNHDPA